MSTSTRTITITIDEVINGQELSISKEVGVEQLDSFRGDLLLETLRKCEEELDKFISHNTITDTTDALD